MFTGHFDVAGKVVVVSGALQGLGAELAKQLFVAGASVYVVARTENKLQHVCRDIVEAAKNASGNVVPAGDVGYVVADVLTPEGCAAVFAHPKLVSTPVDIVMCCAGLLVPGLFVDTPAAVVAQGIATNYSTAALFSHAALQHMVRLGTPAAKRHLVFFSLVVAYYPFIGYGQYAPLKAAVRTLGDVLRQECLPHNIRVLTVFAGNFMSEGFVEEEKTKPEITRKIEGPLDPILCEQCVGKIILQLDRGYEHIHTDTIGWVLLGMLLGASPRQWYPVQVLTALLLALFAPVIQWFINRDIVNFYKRL